MTKQEIQAIRQLPEEYVSDGTLISPFRLNPAPGAVISEVLGIVAMNGAIPLPPIIWNDKTGWRNLILQTEVSDIL